MSYTFELGECTPEKADLFASLMGDLGYENQEMVISSNYTNDPDKINTLELGIVVNDVEKALDALKEADIKEYTFDTTNKIIKIYGGIDDTTVLKEQLNNLTKKLGGNYVEHEFEQAESRFINRRDRRDIYKAWLRAREKRQQKFGKLYTYITKATEVLEQARKQGGTIKADWELLKSLKFRSLTDRYYNKKE